MEIKNVLIKIWYSKAIPPVVVHQMKRFVDQLFGTYLCRVLWRRYQDLWHPLYEDVQVEKSLSVHIPEQPVKLIKNNYLQRRREIPWYDIIYIMISRIYFYIFPKLYKIYTLIISCSRRGRQYNKVTCWKLLHCNNFSDFID